MQKGSHILVVNDDQSLLDLYRMVLETEGYVVHVSLMAFEEIVEVEKMQPDLIILDAKLGYHYEGLLFLQKLKLYPGTRQIPVMICTAATREMREQEETLQQKGIPLLYKPFELDELLGLIEQLLSTSHEENAAPIG